MGVAVEQSFQQRRRRVELEVDDGGRRGLKMMMAVDLPGRPRPSKNGCSSRWPAGRDLEAEPGHPAPGGVWRPPALAPGGGWRPN